MGHFYLRSVESRLLARSLVRLRTVDLSNASLTTDQVTGLCQAIVEEKEGAVLEDLNLKNVYLRDVDGGLLAKAVVLLSRVGLASTRMTADQVSRVLTGVTAGNSRLRTLDMSDLRLSSVDSQLLAGAVARLRSVDIARTGLTAEQLTGLCRAAGQNQDGVVLGGVNTGGVDHGILP